MTSSERAEDDSDADRAGSGPGSKVGRLIEKYGLKGLGADLEADWLGERGERYSLRELAERFNVELLRKAMESAGMTPLEGEVENAYRLLTDDEVTSGVRARTRSRLAQNGVDMDAIDREFVSHQAIHTYLTKYRGASYSDRSATPLSEERIDRRTETIQRLIGRVTAVVEQQISTLSQSGALTIGSFTVLVDIHVLCSDCGQQYSVGDLLQRERCGCEPERP